MPGVVVTRSSPFGRPRLSVSLARAASSFMNTSCAVARNISPCSVRMSPRAWRWKSDTPIPDSSAEPCRDTADCESPSCSPACVKLPASAAAWKTLSLSQSMTQTFSSSTRERMKLFGRDARLRLTVFGEEPHRFQRRHAALPGSGNSLAIDVVGDVAGSEHARDGRRRRIRRGPDVTRSFHLELAGDQFRRGRMSDRDEDAVSWQLGQCAGLDVAQCDAFDLQGI